MKRRYLVVIECYGAVCGMLTITGIAWLIRSQQCKPQVFDVSDHMHPRELTLMFNHATKALALFDNAGAMVEQMAIERLDK